jgi:hypothetical protein
MNVEPFERAYSRFLTVQTVKPNLDANGFSESL